MNYCIMGIVVFTYIFLFIVNKPIYPYFMNSAKRFSNLSKFT